MARSTPGLAPPAGLGEWGGRTYCPGCGAVVTEWLESDWQGREAWEWQGLNAPLNAGRPVPPPPIVGGWGHDVPARLLPLHEETTLDVAAVDRVTGEIEAEHRRVVPDAARALEAEARRAADDGDLVDAARKVEEALALGLSRPAAARALGRARGPARRGARRPGRGDPVVPASDGGLARGLLAGPLRPGALLQRERRRPGCPQRVRRRPTVRGHALVGAALRGTPGGTKPNLGGTGSLGAGDGTRAGGPAPGSAAGSPGLAVGVPPEPGVPVPAPGVPAPAPEPPEQVSERSIRIFVSSTFLDMQAERDELVKRVFPQLRALCEARGVRWSDVDLRWGVTDERRGAVVEICLAEIRACRPYFIGLLGERYGWVPDTSHAGADRRASVARSALRALRHRARGAARRAQRPGDGRPCVLLPARPGVRDDDPGRGPAHVRGGRIGRGGRPPGTCTRG